MERYSTYKDSGVQWLGEIPSHWEVVPLKYCMILNNGRDYKEYESNDGIPVIGTGGQFAYSNKEMFNGEVVFFGRKGTIDKPFHYKGAFWAVDTVFYAEAKSNMICRYLYYLGTTIPFGLYSTSTAIPSMTQTDLLNNPISLPSLAEQQAITSYLDTITSKIDTAIAQQQKMIDLLNERKQIIINNAVTKGLNPNVKMKDSGVDWIGEIPEEWEVKKLKHVCKAFGRIGFRGYSATDLVEEGEGCITLSPSNMRDGRMRYDKCTYLSWEKYEESPEIKIFDGDILFVKTGSTYGKCSIVEDLPSEATINPQLLVLKDFHCNNEFLINVLLTDLIKYQVEISVIGGTIPTISQTKILNYQFACPPKDEQGKIVDYIRNAISPIEIAIKNCEMQISLLQERKQIIINEVVTGKVKVTK